MVFSEYCKYRWTALFISKHPSRSRCSPQQFAFLNWKPAVLPPTPPPSHWHNTFLLISSRGTFLRLIHFSILSHGRFVSFAESLKRYSAALGFSTPFVTGSPFSGARTDKIIIPWTHYTSHEAWKAAGMIPLFKFRNSSGRDGSISLFVYFRFVCKYPHSFRTGGGGKIFRPVPLLGITI